MPEKCGLSRVPSTRIRFSLKTESFQFDLPSTRIQQKRSPKAHLLKNAVQSVASATDETKLWLSPSAKQHRNSCSGPAPVYQDLSMCHDRPVKKAIVNSPIRMKGYTKRTSGNSLSPLGA